MKSATIRMKSNDVAEVLLYDEIGADAFFGGGISAKVFRDQIKSIKAKTINLRINSPGGSVFEGAAMLNALDEFKGDIEVDVDGIAASAASVIAMAGDTIRIANNGMMMIHNPYGMVRGGAEEMRRTAELLDKVKEQILDTYMRRATKTRDELAAMMSDETWLTGQEAIDAGLADEVTGAMALAASVTPELMAKLGITKMPKPAGPTADQIAATEARRARLAAVMARAV